MNKEQDFTHFAIPKDAMNKLIELVRGLPYKDAVPLFGLIDVARPVVLKDKEPPPKKK